MIFLAVFLLASKLYVVPFGEQGREAILELIAGWGGVGGGWSSDCVWVIASVHTYLL